MRPFHFSLAFRSCPRENSQVRCREASASGAGGEYWSSAADATVGTVVSAERACVVRRGYDRGLSRVAYRRAGQRG